jgi:hypothetical protein
VQHSTSVDFGIGHVTQGFLVIVKDAGSSTCDKKGEELACTQA